MKKIITIAALASVALSADFLGHRSAIVKDGANIVKDVKAHRYGKLTKDVVQINKDLGLIHADDEELFNFDALLTHGITTQDVQNQIKGVETQLRKAKELLASKEMIHKTMEENLDLVKRMMPDQYEEMKASLEKEKKDLAEIKEKLKAIEKSIKMTSKVHGYVQRFESWIQADDEELFHLDGLIKNGVKPHKDLVFEDQEFFSTNDFDIKIAQCKKMMAEIERLDKIQQERLPLIKDADPILYEEMTKRNEVMNQKASIADLKKSLDFVEKMKNMLAKHGGTSSPLQTLRGSQIQVDDYELFSLGKLIKEGKNIKEEIKNHNGMI